MLNKKLLFCFCVTFILLSCKTVDNLYERKIEKYNISEIDSNKLYFNGYYYYQFKRFGQKEIVALIFLENGTIIRTWKTDFTDFYSFEEYLISKKFQEILKNSNVLVGSYNLDNNEIVTQFEINYGMRQDYILTNIFEIEEDGAILNHKTSFGEKITNVKDIYRHKEFKGITLLKNCVISNK